MTKPNIKRTIGLSTAIAIVVGSMIGSGIFMRPAEMAGLLGSPFSLMFIWVLAGIVTLFSGMVQAEIGAMLPQTGGQYNFMRNMYGNFWAYLLGWANFAVINTAGTAAIAFIFSQYTEVFVQLPRFSKEIEHSIHLHIPFIGNLYLLENFGVKSLTIIVLCLLTFINYRSVKGGGRLQVVFTAAKVFALLLLVGGLIFSGKGSWTNVVESSTIIKPMGWTLTIAMVAAANGALQAYDGWSNLVNVVGEVKDPAKNLPRGLIWGITICLLVYLAINAALLYILPIDKLAASPLVASDAARVALGPIGGAVIALLIMISTFGATNASVLACPRLTFAMAQEGQFFSSAAQVHSRYQTPSKAFIYHLVWMIILVLSGSFFILADMYIFTLLLFNLLLVIGLFVLRRKMPDTPRPYKVWGYPWMPLLLIAINGFYLITTLLNDIENYQTGKTPLINSVFGLALTALGIPLYWYFRRKKEKDRLAVQSANN